MRTRTMTMTMTMTIPKKTNRTTFMILMFVLLLLTTMEIITTTTTTRTTKGYKSCLSSSSTTFFVSGFSLSSSSNNQRRQTKHYSPFCVPVSCHDQYQQMEIIPILRRNRRNDSMTRKAPPTTTRLYLSPPDESEPTRTTARTPSSFHQFEFASNGVCINPKYFVVTTTNKKKQQQQQGKETIEEDDEEMMTKEYFTMRNVPGEGDCMFLAVALAAATSMGLGANDTLLRAISRETRNVVAQVLSSPTGMLYIGSNVSKPIVSAKSLLQSATQQEGKVQLRRFLQRQQQLQLLQQQQPGQQQPPSSVRTTFTFTTDDYLELLRKEGREGGLYGGGPELTVLANVLRRPISIYEIDYDNMNTNYDDDDDYDENDNHLPIVCKGTFGDGIFEDPLLQINNGKDDGGAANTDPSSFSSSSTTTTSLQSAVLSTNHMQQITPGAYSWHLHILIVDVPIVQQQQQERRMEKHACVLLPQPSMVSSS